MQLKWKEGVFDFDDAFRIALGDVVIQFAGLEASIEHGIGKLLNLEFSQRHIVIARLAFRAKTELLEALAREEWDSGLAGNVKKLMDEARTAAEERNSIQHSLWLNLEDEPTKRELRLKKGKLRLGYKPRIQLGT